MAENVKDTEALQRSSLDVTYVGKPAMEEINNPTEGSIAGSTMITIIVKYWSAGGSDSSITFNGVAGVVTSAIAIEPVDLMTMKARAVED